jgi:hypothetical protein
MTVELRDGSPLSSTNPPRSLNHNTYSTRSATKYSTREPHRALPRRTTPATIYSSGIKATPSSDRRYDSHDHVRSDRSDTTGVVTLRVHGKLHHIGIGRPAGTYVKLLVHDLDVTIIDVATAEILRQLTIDTTRDYQPTGKTYDPTQTKK